MSAAVHPFQWSAKMTKKPCQNNPQFMYTGKESSPRGLGWCAENMTVGERMKGRDGTMWMVSIKNSLHVWTRVPTEVEAPETVAPAAEAAPAAPEPSFAATPAKKKPAPKKKAAAPAAAEPELIPDDLPPLEDTGAVLEDSEAEADAAPAEAAPEPEPEPAPAPKKKAPAKKKAAPAAAPEPEPEAPAAEPEPAPAPKKKAAPRAPKAAAPAPEAEPAPKAATPKAKRPPTDFALFIKMKVREIKAADPAGRANEALSTAAKAWSALSQDEKAQEIARARAAYEAGELA